MTGKKLLESLQELDDTTLEYEVLLPNGAPISYLNVKYRPKYKNSTVYSPSLIFEAKSQRPEETQRHPLINYSSDHLYYNAEDYNIED